MISGLDKPVWNLCMKVSEYIQFGRQMIKYESLFWIVPNQPFQIKDYKLNFKEKDISLDT